MGGSEASENGHLSPGVDPPGGDLRADVLSLEEAIHGLEVDQVRQLKELQEEKVRLKRIAADLTLDKAMLQDMLSKKL